MEGTATAHTGKSKVSGEMAPVIVDHLQSKTVNDGEPVLLSCRVTGWTRIEFYLLLEQYLRMVLSYNGNQFQFFCSRSHQV